VLRRAWRVLRRVRRALRRVWRALQYEWPLFQREWQLFRYPFLPPSLKSGVLRTGILLTARRLRNTLRNTGDGIAQTRILGFDVTAPSFGLLSFLFDEIFVNLDYFFVSRRTDPFILDCGSNIGISILFFKALYPEAEIVAFEPEESTCALLEKNITSNGLSGVQVHQVALGMEESTVDFFVDPESPSSLLMSSKRNTLPKRILVPQVKLSTFIDREVDFLKLDVEGAEDSVLQDLVASGTISKIDQMVVEYHHHIDKSRDAFSAFLGQLENNGFGYQISSSYPIGARVSRTQAFQDIRVYAYRKNPVAKRTPLQS
jgi:FkbM family methyltransferase